MKSDRELLELAAKAAGIKNFSYSDGFRCIAVWNEFGGRELWSPLKNDGDKSRLAEELGIKVVHGKHTGDGCTAESEWFDVPSCTSFCECMNESERRAVVIVAANIGESMP